MALMKFLYSSSSVLCSDLHIYSTKYVSNVETDIRPTLLLISLLMTEQWHSIFCVCTCLSSGFTKLMEWFTVWWSNPNSLNLEYPLHISV